MPAHSKHEHQSRRDHQLSLKVLLIVPFVLQVIAVMAIAGWLSIQNGREATKELAPQIGQEVTNTIETHVRGYFDTPLEILQAHGAAAKSGRIDFENLDSFDQLFWQQMQQVQSLYFFHASNPQGQFIGIERQKDNTLELHKSASTSASSLSKPLFREIYTLDGFGKILNKVSVDVYDPRDRPWYKGAVKARQAVWNPIYLFVARRILGITASLPIYSKSGNLLGVLAIDLPLSQIGDFLRQLKISKTGQAFILESSGDIVATSTPETPYIGTSQGQQRINALNSPNSLLRLTFNNLKQRYPNLENVPNHLQIQIEWEGATQYIQITRLQNPQGLNWLLIVAVSELDYRDRIDINTRNTIILCILALILASLTGFYTSKWIAQPVEKLIKASHLLANLSASADVASGQPYRSIETANVRELSILAESFNQMAHQLQTSFMILAQGKEELEQRVDRRTEALKASETKYRTLIEAANCIILRRDTVGTIKYINDYGITFFGFNSEDELIGKNISGTIVQNQDDTVSDLREWQNNRHTLDIYMFQESQNIRHDGEKVWISWSNRSILDANENVIEILSIGIDITERKRVESTLEEFLSLQRATFESIADGILAVDRVGHVTTYNQQFIDMFALSPEVLSIPDYALRLEFLAEQMINPQDFMLRSQELYRHPELESYDLLELTDGRVLERFSRPQKLKDQIIGRVWSFQDISARVKAEQSLKEQEAYLRLIIDSIPQQIF